MHRAQREEKEFYSKRIECVQTTEKQGNSPTVMVSFESHKYEDYFGSDVWCCLILELSVELLGQPLHVCAQPVHRTGETVILLFKGCCFVSIYTFISLRSMMLHYLKNGVYVSRFDYLKWM